ncbi:putative tail protein [Rhizobium phage RHph_X2_25]|nr:putative tail protein [Rhizobium phage RHph_X2_25]
MDPTYELSAAIIARLKADENVKAFVASRVYDRPTSGTITPPYISMGPSDAITDDADCIDGLEVTLQIDCWSWGSNEAYGSAEVRKLSGAVRAALHEAEIILPTNALATLRHRITRYQRESDGTTNRAIVSIVAFIEIT